MKKVKDFDFYSVTKDGKIYSHVSNRFLKQYNHNLQYFPALGFGLGDHPVGISASWHVAAIWG